MVTLNKNLFIRKMKKNEKMLIPNHVKVFTLSIDI